MVIFGREIAELHKTVAARDSEMKELRLSNDALLREELQKALDKKQREALRDADHLTSQVSAPATYCLTYRVWVLHELFPAVVT